MDCCIRNMALISNQHLNFISAKQILFMSILFREGDEQCRTFCSKEDVDVAKIKSTCAGDIINIFNSCLLNIVYPIHMYIFLAYRTPRCQDLLLCTTFFYPPDTCSSSMSRNIKLAERASSSLAGSAA